MKNLSSSVRIRIHMERIRICMSRVQTELKWDEWIRIPKWWIRIFKSKFQSEAADRSWICTPKKKGIFVYVPDIFGLGLFLTKMKIRSKSFYSNWFCIISSSSTTPKLIPIQESLLRSEEVKIALSDSNPNQKDSNPSMYFEDRKLWMAKDSNLLLMDSNPSPGNSKLH